MDSTNEAEEVVFTLDGTGVLHEAISKGKSTEDISRCRLEKDEIAVQTGYEHLVLVCSNAAKQEIINQGGKQNELVV